MKKPFVHLILAGAVCVGVLASYGFWYAAVAAKSAAVASLQSQINAKTETMDRANMARTVLAEIAGDEAIVQGYFVPETGVVAFIDGLESQARSLGATLNVVSVSTSGTPARPALALALTIGGTFDAVIRTLGAIEYAPYAISLSELSIGQEAKNIWNINLKMLVGSTAATTTTRTP